MTFLSTCPGGITGWEWTYKSERGDAIYIVRSRYCGGYHVHAFDAETLDRAAEAWKQPEPLNARDLVPEPSRALWTRTLTGACAAARRVLAEFAEAR